MFHCYKFNILAFLKPKEYSKKTKNNCVFSLKCLIILHFSFFLKKVLALFLQFDN